MVEFPHICSAGIISISNLHETNPINSHQHLTEALTLPDEDESFHFNKYDDEL
jgi:hypothetical protein